MSHRATTSHIFHGCSYLVDVHFFLRDILSFIEMIACSCKELVGCGDRPLQYVWLATTTTIYSIMTLDATDISPFDKLSDLEPAEVPIHALLQLLFVMRNRLVDIS